MKCLRNEKTTRVWSYFKIYNLQGNKASLRGRDQNSREGAEMEEVLMVDGRVIDRFVIVKVLDLIWRAFLGKEISLLSKGFKFSPVHKGID